VLAALRSRVTFANVVSMMALFVALSGGAYALTIPKDSVGAKQLKRNAVTRSKLRNGAVDSTKVQDRSLLATDFKVGELPAGAQGPPGERGPAGVAGSARAHGRIDSLACQPLNPGVSCPLSKSKGITSVVRGTVQGTYCVTAPGLSSVSLPMFVTVDYATSVTGATLTALSDERSPSPFCSDQQFAVLTFADFEDAAAPALRGDIGFTVMIP
jgi:hypothetical protein